MTVHIRQELCFQGGVKIMIKNSQNSLVDYLVELMPGLNIMQSKNVVDDRAAESLFNIWKDSSNKLSEDVYKRPETTPISKVNLMQQQGLVVVNGQKLEITKKGKDVIKTMILGDDNSIFDKKETGYIEAYQNTKLVTRASNIKNKVASNWWERFEK